jgi:hypothetical protein
MKIYSYFFILVLVSTDYVAKAQTDYVTTAVSGNWSASTTWLGGVPPPSPCDFCDIRIQPGVTVTLDESMDLTGIGGPSQLTITGTASLVVDQPLELENNSTLLVGNNTSTASLIVNQEIDLVTNSFVQLADSNSYIDASAAGPGTGLVGTGSGMYVITSVGPVTSGILVNSTGFKVFPINNPSFNCGVNGPNPCVTGVVYGPAYSLPNDVVSGSGFFSGTTPLPVVLIKFAASLNSNETVSLSWTTAQEDNSSYFSVQRSPDGNSFDDVGKVNAKGFSSIASNYGFTDPSVIKGTTFYRLQIVDLDGKYVYSKVLTVSSDAIGNSLLVFSNPFKDEVRLQINLTSAEQISLSLTDILGRSIVKMEYSAQTGSNFINLQPGNGAMPGVYILNIKSNTINNTIKLIKQE